MGYNAIDRFSALKKQVDDGQIGRWTIGRVFVLSLILLWVGNTILAFTTANNNETPSRKVEESWEQQITRDAKEKMAWLDNSPFSLFGAGSLYALYAETIISTVAPDEHARPDDELSGLFGSFSPTAWFRESLTSSMLRAGFVLICSWPLWIIGAYIGYYFVSKSSLVKPTKSFLGVLDRGKGPFYSGIYGPLRPNNKGSGTDLSCPGLACPLMAGQQASEAHKLSQMLKRVNALNETTLGLVRVILAHQDFPSLVEEENFAPEEPAEQKDILDPEKASRLNLFTNETGILVDGAVVGLESILDAHERIRRYVGSLEKKGFSSEALNKSYPSHISSLQKLVASSPVLVQNLILSLTPNRLWTLAHLQASVVASAYLACEAGKALVYKRHGSAFSRISLFPHLQARAVIQSLNSFHSEYDGDTRLIIRQAIICSRRHGDFGRAFLPNRMPNESRALRDWLEILYAEPKKRDDAAYLVELDGHIEELHNNWRIGFSRRLRDYIENNSLSNDTDSLTGRLWKGFVYKSVVLTPVRDVVDVAIKGVHPSRILRIDELIERTRKHQMRITISARLPGFKRQALEADKCGEGVDAIIAALVQSKDGETLANNWRVVRRMLTKYNWLSTRVGDDAVPIPGLVEAIVYQEENGTDLSAVVPLRHRRFAELFGRHWENVYYTDMPSHEDIDVFVDHSEYLKDVSNIKPPKNSVKSNMNDTNQITEKKVVATR